MELVRQHASELTDREKMELAEEWLGSLPPNTDDSDVDDDGLVEVRRRARELDENPSIAITWEQLRKSVGR